MSTTPEDEFILNPEHISTNLLKKHLRQLRHKIKIPSININRPTIDDLNAYLVLKTDILDSVIAEVIIPIINDTYDITLPTIKDIKDRLDALEEQLAQNRSI